MEMLYLSGISNTLYGLIINGYQPRVLLDFLFIHSDDYDEVNYNTNYSQFL